MISNRKGMCWENDPVRDAEVSHARSCFVNYFLWWVVKEESELHTQVVAITTLLFQCRKPQIATLPGSGALHLLSCARSSLRESSGRLCQISLSRTICEKSKICQHAQNYLGGPEMISGLKTSKPLWASQNLSLANLSSKPRHTKWALGAKGGG